MYRNRLFTVPKKLTTHTNSEKQLLGPCAVQKWGMRPTCAYTHIRVEPSFSVCTTRLKLRTRLLRRCCCCYSWALLPLHKCRDTKRKYWAKQWNDQFSILRYKSWETTLTPQIFWMITSSNSYFDGRLLKPVFILYFTDVLV